MDTKQPEALILAALNDAETWPGELSIVTFAARAAAELRRLHAENETLRAGYDAARLEIASLHTQMEAVGAGGMEPLRKRCLHQISEPAKAGWCDGCSPDNCGGCVTPAAPAQEGDSAQATLEMIADVLGIGSEARKNHSTLVHCIKNATRRSDCLSRIEHGFFMGPTPPDEDDDGEPGAECLLNWGQSPDEYEQQFGAALDTIIAARGADQATDVQQDAERYRWLRDGEWRGTDLEPFIRLQLNKLWDAKIDAAIAAQQGGA